jgi:hypothetical protein
MWFILYYEPNLMCSIQSSKCILNSWVLFIFLLVIFYKHIELSV